MDGIVKRKSKRNKRKPSVLCESGMYQSRVTLMTGVVMAGFVLVIIWCFGMQIINSDKLQAEAYSQWQMVMNNSAARGEILDATGTVLATNVTSYRILIHPQDIAKDVSSDDYPRIARELSEVLGLDYDYVYKRVSDTVNPGSTKKISEYILARRVDKAIADKVIQLNLCDGIVVENDLTRKYPCDNLLSQVMGYTNYDGKGQAGIELSYDKYLSGQDGKTVIDRTGTGARLPFGKEESVETTQGCNVVLTVDINLQYFLENALTQALEVNSAQSAQGIIMDAKTGAIKAISSKPDYNPNEKPDTVEELNKLSRNRIVADSYEPGSTFKIVTLASAIDSGTVNDNYSCTCGGSLDVNGERIKCWRSRGHGTQTLTQCAENSCNCAFMDMALDMGTDKFYDYIYEFGLGASTGSGLPAEDAGIVTNRKSIRATDLARIGFGQSIAVTPIQLVTAVSAAVNGGNLMQPYIVDSVLTTDGEEVEKTEPVTVRRVVSEETSAHVRKILESVVENGSGKNAKIAGYRVGGKTGTAQKYEDGKVSSGKLIASFVGIAPIDDPRYVCLILVDEPQVNTIFGSTVAAPFVKQVLESALEYSGFDRKSDAGTVKVPDLMGMSVAQAERKLNELGLTADYQETDTIVNQVPTAGTEVAVGTGVLLYTENTKASEVKDTVEVPKLVGMTRYEAYAALKALGLEMEVVTEYHGGRVQSQYPYYGDEAEVGSSVQVKFE